MVPIQLPACSFKHTCMHVQGAPGPRHADREAAAIGAATLTFFRNRASSPRDMSAAAAEQLRTACMDVLVDMY